MGTSFWTTVVRTMFTLGLNTFNYIGRAFAYIRTLITIFLCCQCNASTTWAKLKNLATLGLHINQFYWLVTKNVFGSSLLKPVCAVEYAAANVYLYLSLDVLSFGKYGCCFGATSLAKHAVSIHSNWHQLS